MPTEVPGMFCRIYGTRDFEIKKRPCLEEFDLLPHPRLSRSFSEVWLFWHTPVRARLLPAVQSGCVAANSSQKPGIPLSWRGSRYAWRKNYSGDIRQSLKKAHTRPGHRLDLIGAATGA